MVAIGDRIKSARKKKHITQTQLARKMKMTQQMISKIEHDLIQPDSRMIESIAHALDVPVSTFFERQKKD